MLPPGISVTEARGSCSRIRATLRQFPEVGRSISKAGRPEDGTDPKLINMAEMFVDLKPPSEWRRGVYEGAADRADERRARTRFPGIEPSFSQPIRDNVLESISQIDGQIVIKVFGDDLADAAARRRPRCCERSSPCRGVARAFIDRGGEVPQLQIEIDRARAARYGLNVADVQDVIETALGGKTATEIWEGERRFAVVVRLARTSARDPDAIRQRARRHARRTAHAALRGRDRVASAGGSMNIARESGTRVHAIGVFIHGRDMGSVVADMQDRVATTVQLPAGYYADLGRRVREPAARDGAARA